jgi:hypothetical protein
VRPGVVEVPLHRGVGREGTLARDTANGVGRMGLRGTDRQGEGGRNDETEHEEPPVDQLQGIGVDR